MWNDLEYGFHVAFDTAWESYKKGNILIGAAILDADGGLVAASANQIGSDAGLGPLYGSKLAHAEINAILRAGNRDDIRSCTLYTTCEPCPLCFGAIVMGNLRYIKYSSRDPWAGSCELNAKSEYIESKKIVIEGPFGEPEFVSVAFYAFWESRRGNINNPVMRREREVFPEAVAAGEVLFRDGSIDRLREMGIPFSEVYDYILSLKRSG